jgi:hypothetical protein
MGCQPGSCHCPRICSSGNFLVTLAAVPDAAIVEIVDTIFMPLVQAHNQRAALRLT